MLTERDTNTRLGEPPDTCWLESPLSAGRLGEKALNQTDQPSLKDLLLTEVARTELLAAQRGKLKRSKAGER